MLYLTVGRLFEIEGEALYRALRFEQSLIDSLVDAQSLIGLRNRIAYDYDTIDLGIVGERHSSASSRN